MLFSLISLVLSFIAGFFLSDIVLCAGKGWSVGLLKTLVGTAVVFAFKTLLAFLIVLRLGRVGPAFLVVEIGLALFALAGWLWTKKSLRRPESRVQVPLGSGGSFTFAEGVLLVLTVGMMMWVSLHGLSDPLGWWDAFSSWNVAAQWIFAGEWEHLLIPRRIPGSPPYFTDHPLFNPMFTAIQWAYWGKPIPWVPALQSVLFFWLTVLLLFVALYVFTGRKVAIFGTATLVSVPRFAMYGAVQYVDLTYAFFLLVFTVCCLLVAGGFVRSMKAAPILLGFAVGQVLWVKNEGLIFFLVAAAVYGVTSARNMDRRSVLSGWLFFILGALFPLVVYGIFKSMLRLEAASLLAWHPQGWLSIAEHMFNPCRYWAVLRHSFEHYQTHTDVGPFLGVVAVLGLYFLLAVSPAPSGFGVRLAKPFLMMPLWTLSILFVLYHGVFVVSPMDIAFYTSSVDRLVLHVMPSGVLLFFLFCVRYRESSLGQESP